MTAARDVLVVWARRAIERNAPNLRVEQIETPAEAEARWNVVRRSDGVIYDDGAALGWKQLVGFAKTLGGWDGKEEVSEEELPRALHDDGTR